jgi:hypothetical protein
MYNNKLVKAYQMAPTYIPNSLAKKPVDVRTSLGPVDRQFANVETEGGETVYLPSKEGLPAHYKINGPRHFEGGVPMSIPPDSFIYSDTASMRIKDPELQTEFGMPIKKKGYTPAEIAKKYDINKYRRILVDPMSDKLQVNTAEQVIANYQLKLAKLALIQESMKGFPAGIPLVAMPYLAKYQLDPKMFLPVQTGNDGQGEEETEEQPEARYGGSLRRFADGGQNPQPSGQPGYYVPPGYTPTQTRREKRKLERERRNQILDQILMQVISQAKSQNENKALEYDGPIFYKEDENGNPYYVDDKGKRLDSMDEVIYGKDNQPTIDNTRIITKNGKRYKVEVKQKATNIDPSKLKPKADAVNPGDIYEENGKYYVVRQYDKNKPIHSTKTGEKYNGDFEADKVRALALLEDLEKKGHAVFHDRDYQVGTRTRKPGWEIRSSAKNALSTSDKEFLTDFLSYSKSSGIADSEKNPKFNVSLQTAGGTGFYGYTDPNFYEYRFWKAKNPNKTGEDWDKADKKTKVDNRRDMLYSLGFDTKDPHIAKNLENPDALYSSDFVSGKKKVATNRVISDADGNTYDELGLTDAVENYFGGKDGWRPIASDDKKLGLDHADAFTFERPVEEMAGPGEKTVETEIPNETKTPEYSTGDKYSPWWLQDVIKTTGAAIDYLSIKKYMPAKFQYDPYIPEPTFYDPNREIAATQETANIAAGLIAGAGNKGASTYSSRAAAIQGTAAKEIADILGRYNTQNVGVANEFAYKSAEIMNQAQLVNLEANQKYVDQVNTVNQNYDNAKRAAREQLRNSYVDAITNRSQAQVLNTLYPNYQIDPSRGGDLVFYKGKDITGVDTPSSLPADQFVSWAERNPQYTLSQATSIWSAANKAKSQEYDPDQAYLDSYMNTVPANSVPGNPLSYAGYMQGQEQQKKGGPKLPFLYTVGY